MYNLQGDIHKMLNDFTVICCCRWTLYFYNFAMKKSLQRVAAHFMEHFPRMLELMLTHGYFRTIKLHAAVEFLQSLNHN